MGELAGLKSLLLGFEIEEIKRWSFCSVGRVYRCTRVRGGLASSFVDEASSSLPSGSGSGWSCEFRIMVQPGGNGEWWFARSLDRKKRPPKTGVTVKFWPFGRCTIEGAIVVSAGEEDGEGS